VITLPVADPNYGHDKYVQVFAIDPVSGKLILIARYAAPFTGSTIAWSGSDPTIQQTTTAQPGWGLRFVPYNEYYEPGTPYDLPGTLTIAAAGISSVTVTDETTLRWQDTTTALRAVISFVPVVSNLPMNIVAWIDKGHGGGKKWQGWDCQTSASSNPGKTLYIGGQRADNGGTDITISPTLTTGAVFPPVTADETWTLYVAPWTQTINDTGVCPSSAISQSFTMHAVATPSSTAATGAYVDSITYSPISGGGMAFGWPHIYVTLPLSDPNFWFARLTVQTGTLIGGVFTPGGVHAVEEPLGDWDTDADHGVGFFRVTGTDQVYNQNPNYWVVPTDGNTCHRMRWYVASRLDDGTGGTLVLEHCWSSAVGVSTPGTADHQDIVVAQGAVGLFITITTGSPPYLATIDLNTAPTQELYLTMNAEMASVINIYGKGTWTLFIVQDNTGGHAVTFDSGSFANATALATMISTVANTYTALTFARLGTGFYYLVSPVVSGAHI
jgi:hypothetical protein